MRRSRCRRNSPTGFICAFFATFMGFALIWHIWWMVARGSVRRIRDLRRLRLAGQGRVHHSGREVARIDRANRSARSEALARLADGAMSALRGDRRSAGHRTIRRADTASMPPADWRPSASSSATASGSSCSATSSCSPPSSRPMRCWSGQTAGGPSGQELFDLRNIAIETACLLLSSFTCGLAAIGAQARRGSWFYGAMAATFILGAAFIGLEIREFAGLVAQRGGPDPQRVPVGLLYAGRLPWPARDRWPAVAADDDGAGVRQGIPGRHSPARSSASACSGTPWISSGLRCSRWCI